MSVLTTRFTILAAVALVAVAQAVVAPASCCVLSEALFEGEPCCQLSTVDTASKACCTQRAATADSPEGDRDSTPASPSDCPWCSAAPKVSVAERVTVPSVEVAGILPAVDVAVIDHALTSKEASHLAELDHKTALAMCARLCVWRI